jgi:hypothetical protein
MSSQPPSQPSSSTTPLPPLGPPSFTPTQLTKLAFINAGITRLARESKTEQMEALQKEIDAMQSLVARHAWPRLDFDEAYKRLKAVFDGDDVSEKNKDTGRFFEAREGTGGMGKVC